MHSHKAQIPMGLRHGSRLYVRAGSELLCYGPFGWLQLLTADGITLCVPNKSILRSTYTHHTSVDMFGSQCKVTSPACQLNSLPARVADRGKLDGMDGRSWHQVVRGLPACFHATALTIRCSAIALGGYPLWASDTASSSDDQARVPHDGRSDAIRCDEACCLTRPVEVPLVPSPAAVVFAYLGRVSSDDERGE